MLHFFSLKDSVVFQENLMFLKVHSVVLGRIFKTDFFMHK